MTKMETIGVTKFSKNLSSYIEKVQMGQPITITSYGYLVAMLVPADDEMEASRKSLRELRKTAQVGDIVSPIEDRWETMT